jgi:2-polyprenyl-3-methyl-5-hydroxy-6-metoxy-1,4-benzoquinol methylase
MKLTDYDEEYFGLNAGQLDIPRFIGKHVGEDGRSRSSDYRLVSQLREVQKTLKTLNRKASPEARRESFTNKLLLDYGCGLGDFMVAARDFGFQPWGVEVSDPAISFCRTQHKLDVLHVKSRTELPREFGVVRLAHVLEHVSDPRDLLEFSRDRLEAGGLLYIEVPNFSSFMSTLRGKSWRFIRKDHLSYFARTNLAALLEKSGLTVLQMNATGSLGVTPLLSRWLSQWSGPFIKYHPWGLPAKIAYLSLMSRLRLGDFIRVYATKPTNGA